jgi:hypothetical protein
MIDLNGAVVVAASQLVSIPFWDAISDGYEGPLYSPNPWETVVIDGYKLPGICKVTATSKQRIEIKKTKGKDGAKTILLGIDPSSVDIEIMIWTSVQLAELVKVLRAIWRRPSKAANADREQPTTADVTAQAALTIETPACAMVNILSVVLEGVQPLVLQPDGTAKMKITAIQYIKPPAKSTVRRVDGSGRVNIAKPFQGSQNASAIHRPSEHEAGPTVPQPPRRGTH